MSPAQVATVNGCANSALRGAPGLPVNGVNVDDTHCACGSAAMDGAHAKLLTTCAAGPAAAAAKSTAVNGPLSGRPPGPSMQRITASGKPTVPLPLCSAITSVRGGHGRTRSDADQITPLTALPVSRR